MFTSSNTFNSNRSFVRLISVDLRVTFTVTVFEAGGMNLSDVTVQVIVTLAIPSEIAAMFPLLSTTTLSPV